MELAAESLPPLPNLLIRRHIASACQSSHRQLGRVLHIWCGHEHAATATPGYQALFFYWVELDIVLQRCLACVWHRESAPVGGRHTRDRSGYESHGMLRTHQHVLRQPLILPILSNWWRRTHSNNRAV